MGTFFFFFSCAVCEEKGASRPPAPVLLPMVACSIALVWQEGIFLRAFRLTFRCVGPVSPLSAVLLVLSSVRSEHFWGVRLWEAGGVTGN